jgi:hypothetical protein
MTFIVCVIESCFNIGKVNLEFSITGVSCRHLHGVPVNGVRPYFSEAPHKFEGRIILPNHELIHRDSSQVFDCLSSCAMSFSV